MRINPWSAVLLLGVPVAFLIIFFIVPFGTVAVTSFRMPDGGWSAANYEKIATCYETYKA